MSIMFRNMIEKYPLRIMNCIKGDFSCLVFITGKHLFAKTISQIRNPYYSQ